MSWRIEFFEVRRGTSPPWEFLIALPPKARAKVTRVLDLVAEYGPSLGEPYVKRLAGRDLFELRISLGSDAFRFFFFPVSEDHLVVVHGIRKKTQRTPVRDLDTAELRRADYLRRK